MFLPKRETLKSLNGSRKINFRVGKQSVCGFGEGILARDHLVSTTHCRDENAETTTAR